MTIIGSVVKNGIKYTKNGCRLLSKTTETLDIPLGVVSTARKFEKVVIETDFGKALKTISTQRGANGKPISRTITETRNGEVVWESIKDYTYDGSIRTIKTTNKGRGGILLGESEEVVNCLGHDVTDKGITPIVTRVKFDKHFGGGGERLEHQLYETFVRGEGRTKHLETYAKRLGDGQVVDTRVTGAGVDVKELANDPYLFIRNYNLEDFTNSARWIAEKDQRVSGLGGRFVVKPIKKYGGYYQNSGNLVVIDATRPYCTKQDLVDTINHEFRHKFQHKKGSQFVQRFLNLFRTQENKVPIYKDWGYAIKNKVAEILYPFTTFVHKGYWNNFLEVDARRAGSFASDVYKLHSEKLAKNFGGPDRMYFVNDAFGLDNEAVKAVIQEAIAQSKVVTIPLNIVS